MLVQAFKGFLPAGTEFFIMHGSRHQMVLLPSCVLLGIAPPELTFAYMYNKPTLNNYIIILLI